MKNFFKKLSFVLAIAMVLTSLAPATASAAAKNYVAVNGKKATATYAYIGGKEVVLTPYVNGKKATKVTIENSNPEKATIDNNGVITPVANGNTIVTFKKGDKKIGTVTVKVRTRAKALNIYDRAEYKAGNKEKLSEVTLKVGDKKDLQITMPLYKASKKAGAKKASYFTYPEVSDSSVVKVTKNAGQRNFTVEALAAGTAKVTIVANQKTEKNVRADKYYKEASFDVTVKDEKLTATQSGANKIKVTGTDLTDKVADYTLKLGSATKTLSSAKVEEDGSVTLTASASYFVDGDYTLKFGELSVDLKLEGSKATKIVVEPEVAILTGTQSAIVYFQVQNQWGEDVTAKADLNAVGTNLDQTNSLVNKGKLKFTLSGSDQYQLNLSQIAVNIMDKNSGANYSNVLTVSDYSKLKEVELKGIYEVVGNVAKEFKLKEGATDTDLQNVRLLVAGKDQYGLTFDASKINANNLNLYATGLTGFSLNGFDTTATATSTVKIDNVEYALVKVKVASGFTTGLKGGEATVQGYVLTGAGDAISAKFTVGSGVKIASLSVSANDVIYGGDEVELSYEALDADGNSVTDIETLCAYNNQSKQSGALKSSTLEFVGSKDGKARLMFTAPSTGTQSMESISWITDTNVYGYKTLTIMPDRKATSVIGVWTYSEVEKPNGLFLGATSGSSVRVTVRNLKYEDQYGNTIPYKDFNKCVSGSGIKVRVTSDFAGIADVFGAITTSGSIHGTTSVTVDSTTASDKVVEFTSKATNASGSAVYTVGLESEKTVNGSTRKANCEFKVAAVATKDLTITAGFWNPNFYVTAPAVDVQVAANYVEATYGKLDVKPTKDWDYKYSYDVLPKLDTLVDGKDATAKGAVSILVNDGKGTIKNVDYTATNASTKITGATVYSDHAGHAYFNTRGYEIVTGSAASLSNAYSINAAIDVSHSANRGTTGLLNTDARVTFSDIPEGAQVNDNGSTSATIQFKTPNATTDAAFYHTVTVTYSWNNGFSTSEVICFKVVAQ